MYAILNSNVSFQLDFKIPLLRRGGRDKVPDGVVAVRNLKNYKFLPYNPRLLEHSKKLKKAGILHEVLLWQQLKGKKLNGLDFDRQKIIGDYIVDFYCSERNIVIEVDGYTHDNKCNDDAERDIFLKNLGLSVIRVLAVDVLNNLESVVKFLQHHPALKRTPPQEGN